MNEISEQDLQKLGVNELRDIAENAQRLIASKQHQQLYDAYVQFEEIAEACHSSIDDILEAGEKLEKERSIKYRDPNNADNIWIGRGRKPKWLIKAINEGADISDFEI